jgi:hypothetical protein
MKKRWELTALIAVIVIAVGAMVFMSVRGAEAARAGSRGPRAALLDPGPSGRAVNYPYDEFVQGMKNDGVAHGGTNKIVDGTTLNVAAKWLAANKCIRVETEGIWTGSSAAKSVRLTAMNGATAVDLLVLAGNTMPGMVVATFHLCGVGSGYTAQEAWGLVVVSGSTTIGYGYGPRATTSFNFGHATTIKTRWSSGAAGDVVTQKFAQFFMEP